MQTIKLLQELVETQTPVLGLFGRNKNKFISLDSKSDGESDSLDGFIKSIYLIANPHLYMYADSWSLTGIIAVKSQNTQEIRSDYHRKY